MRRHDTVDAFYIGKLNQVERMICGLLLAIWLTLLLPPSAAGMISANLTWVASNDPTVTGYDIYYGTANNQYTNNFLVGPVTNAVVSGLTENTVYFFGAKARNSTGNESGFSNEAAFAGFNASVGSALQLRAMPQGLTTDALQFSLNATAPQGATINPTNGILSWTPGNADASTTNYLNVSIIDPANSAFSVFETVEVIVERDSATAASPTLRHGRCERYFPVFFEGAHLNPGDSATVKIESVDRVETFGRLVAEQP